MAKPESSNVETVASDEAPTPTRRRDGPDLDPGAAIGRYQVLDRLGAGGMGVVYAAYDPELDRRVAIKLLRAGVGGRGSKGRARLQREAQAMAKIDHPNVVAVHDVGTVDDHVYVAMELIDGLTLDRWLKKDKPSCDEILDVFAAAGRGLIAAHEQGLVHRDFKPENVMVDAGDAGRGERRVRVMDFGLAHADRSPTASSESVSKTSGSFLGSKLTRDGAVVGTPAYMAPEQFEGSTTDARADQFSFCVALWEALYGERPFPGKRIPELVESLVSGRFRTPPRSVKVPARVRRALVRGLAVGREERWPSMSALLAELRPPPARRNLAWASGGVLVTAALGGVAWVQTRPQPCTGAAEALGDVWDAARHERVEAAVLASGAAFAPALWARVGPAVEAWGAEWIEGHTEACRATRVDGAQSESLLDQRMGCLARAKAGLGAALEVLEEADPDRLSKAHRVVAGLPRLSACSDAEVLEHAIVPPPADAEETVATVRATLATAAARLAAGDLEAAEAATEMARAAVADIDYPPIDAEVEVTVGAVRSAAGDYPASEAAYLAARELGARHDLRDIVLGSTVQLIYVRGYQQGRTEAALASVDLARGLASHDRRAQAQLANNVGAVYQVQAKYAEAEAAFREALEIKTEEFGAGDPEVAAARSNLAVSLHGQGKFEEAEAEHRTALDIRRAALGPMHPDLSTSYNNLAEALLAQGRYAEGEKAHRAGLELALAAFGADHPEVASSRHSMANAIWAQGRYAEAEAGHRAALEVMLRVLGPDHPDVAMVRSDLGNALHSQGENAAAEKEFRAAIALLTKVHGAEHPLVAMTRGNLCTLLATMGRRDDARVECEASLAGLTATLGADHPYVGQGHGNLADLLRTGGKLEAAETEYRTALRIYDESLDADHPGVALYRGGLGLTLFAAHRAEEAMPHLRYAWDHRESAGLIAPFVAELATALGETP